MKIRALFLILFLVLLSGQSFGQEKAKPQLPQGQDRIKVTIEATDVTGRYSKDILEWMQQVAKMHPGFEVAEDRKSADFLILGNLLLAIDSPSQVVFQVITLELVAKGSYVAMAGFTVNVNGPSTATLKFVLDQSVRQCMYNCLTALPNYVQQKRQQKPQDKKGMEKRI